MDTPEQRPAPPGALTAELDVSCCMAWCFVRCPPPRPLHAPHLGGFAADAGLISGSARLVSVLT
eukprot:1790102-Rhodomonas_salina.18